MCDHRILSESDKRDLSLRLLRDLRRVLEEEQHLHSPDLLVFLLTRHSPWSREFPLTPQLLASILSDFGVFPGSWGMPGAFRQAYALRDLMSAWERFPDAGTEGAGQ